MYHLNNLDVIILVIVVVSALIAFARGLVKEVLSIIGWVLATAAIIYLLPMFLPFVHNFVSNNLLAGVVTSLSIFTIFFIFWIYFSSHIIVKIRSSKLNSLDRLLGLFFGVMRAFLLIILFNILVSWIVPADSQSEFLRDSKYFKLASSFAKPIEELIPEETLNLIKSKSGDFIKEGEVLSDSNKESIIPQDEDVLELFVKLAQPQLKSDTKPKPDNTSGYEKSERESLDRLIDSVE